MLIGLEVDKCGRSPEKALVVKRLNDKLSITIRMETPRALRENMDHVFVSWVDDK